MILFIKLIASAHNNSADLMTVLFPVMSGTILRMSLFRVYFVFGGC